MGVPTIKLNHLYDEYGLYQALYGSTFDIRAFEVVGATIACETLHHEYFNGKTDLSILELFGGHSEHRDLFNLYNKVPVKCYDALEIQKHAAGPSHVKIGNALEKWPGLYNMSFAFYFSICSPMDTEADAIRRKDLLRYFSNVYANLERAGGGGHYFCLGGAEGLRDFIVGLHDVGKRGMYFVPPHHPMRAKYGIGPYDHCEFMVEERTEWDRRSGAVTCYFKAIELLANGRVKAKFKVKRPFVLRNWTEQEITDIVQEAGFEHLHYYSNITDESARGEYRRPELVLTNKTAPDGEDENAVKGQLATDMMVVVPPAVKRKLKKVKRK